MLNMLIMLNVFELTDPSRCTPEKKKKFNITAVRSTIFQKCASFSWNVEYVECVLGGFPKKVLLSAVMLNMLIMLNAFWTYRPFQVHPRKKSNIQHYSCEKHIFFRNVLLSAEMLNMLNMFLECFRKKVLLSGEMLNMLNMLNAFGTYRPLLNEANKFIQHIQHIQHFPRNKHILGERLSNIFNILNISAERSTFFEKYASFSCNVECCAPLRQLGCLKGVCKFQKHSTYSTYSTFPQKETNFWERLLKTFNIFNISAERSTFWGKTTSFGCNVECWVPPRQLGGGWGGLWVGGCWVAKVEAQERYRERYIEGHARAHTHTSTSWEAAREKEKDKLIMQGFELEWDGRSRFRKGLSEWKEKEGQEWKRGRRTVIEQKLGEAKTQGDQKPKTTK